MLIVVEFFDRLDPSLLQLLLRAIFVGLQPVVVMFLETHVMAGQYVSDAREWGKAYRFGGVR